MEPLTEDGSLESMRAAGRPTAKDGGRARRVSTRALGLATAVGASSLGAAALAAPAQANTYWPYQCTQPKQNHDGAYHFPNNTLHNEGHARGGCAGGTGLGVPCIAHSTGGGLYCSGGFGGYVYSTFTSHASGGEVAVARLCGACNGQTFYKPHYLSGYSYYN